MVGFVRLFRNGGIPMISIILSRLVSEMGFSFPTPLDESNQGQLGNLSLPNLIRSCPASDSTFNWIF